MGNQTFMYVVHNGFSKLLITKRLYLEMLSDTNGKEMGQAEYLIKKKLRECASEVRPDDTGKKPSIII